MDEMDPLEDPEITRALREAMEAACPLTAEETTALHTRIMESIKTISHPMERLKGRKFPVLDDGFIQFVDYMGTDASIVQAARGCYGDGTKEVQDDRGLIRYLMRHWHTTPFEMCEIKVRVRVPMVAREQARKDLPLSTYTEAYWKIDLHDLLHFLRLHLDSHAQEEIRAYAMVISDIVKEWVPLVWEAFVDYRKEALQLTRLDKEIIRSINDGLHARAFSAPIELANSFGWGSKRAHRERQECEVKLADLGFEIPWAWVGGKLVAA